MRSKSNIINQTYGNRLRIRVCGILIEKDKVLMVKHQSIGASGVFWAPPGGGMEYGEDAQLTLKREFREETGLDVEVKELLFVNEYLNKPLHGIELFFKVKSRGGTLKKGYDPEMSVKDQIIESVEWLDMDKINAMPSSHLHNAFWELGDLNKIYEKKGYMKRTQY